MKRNQKKEKQDWAEKQKIQRKWMQKPPNIVLGPYSRKQVQQTATKGEQAEDRMMMRAQAEKREGEPSGWKKVAKKEALDKDQVDKGEVKEEEQQRDKKEKDRHQHLDKEKQTKRKTQASN